MSAIGRYWPMLLVVGCPLFFWVSPHPVGLSVETWRMVGVYLALLSGIVFRPFTDAVIVLIILGFGSLFYGPEILLKGYGNSMVWFILVAFLICRAFAITGLGKRIAYLLLKKYGRSSLGLGYLMLLTDLALAPATASNMSRTGGITFPIFRNIAETLGSQPGPSARKIGAYLSILMYVISMGTSTFFLTGMATNSITASLAKQVLDVNLTWMTWFVASVVPSGLLLLAAPLIIYKLYPPELRILKGIKEIAEAGLAELGPMKRSEKILLILFLFAVLGWMTGAYTDISMQAVGLAFLAAQLLTKVMTWDDLIQEKSAWATFVWYGGFFGCATVLAAGGFYKWLVTIVQAYVTLSDIGPNVAIVTLVGISMLARYFFVSNSAFVVSFYPVLFTLGLSTQASPMLIALSLGFSAGYGSLLTHYGNGAGVITFAAGYVPQKTFWGLGTAMALISAIVYYVIGVPYWKLIGLI
ncbi:DASS family sodium-coupled anion symporter [Rhodopseudomonas palustris]|uniref:Anion transporter n=1 Tax=Rhodopseudomonas palustris (strain BisB18) TaxID=316056 RepID=Q214B3_RHOPB